MKDTIRCFIAIPLPADLKTSIDKYITGLKNINPEVKWIKARSLHITLKFLGDIEPTLVEKVSIATLDIPGAISPFKIRVSETGAFPNRRRPRVLWLGIQSLPYNPLYDLQEKIEVAVEPLGFEREKRRFNPHLTLGRVKAPANFHHLWKYIDTNPFTSVEFEVQEFLLIRSFLKPTGAEYRIIQKYPLRLS